MGDSAIIIEKVAYGMTIGDMKFGNVRPGVVEATLKPGRTLEEALDELDDRFNAWHRKKYPHLYQESNGEWKRDGIWDKWTDLPNDKKTQVTFGNGPIPIISKEETVGENVLELINNAPDMPALTSFKLMASRNPELYKAYCQRLKYLSA